MWRVSAGGTYYSYGAGSTACDGAVGGTHVYNPGQFTCFPGSSTTASLRNYGLGGFERGKGDMRACIHKSNDTHKLSL